ncbi:hypothetical protein Tco_0742971 [Tanacetum coccineum]
MIKETPSRSNARATMLFSTCTLLGNALTWWNSQVRIVGNDIAYAMTWAELKKKMTDKYCLRTEIKKLEVELWELKVKESDKIEKYVGGLPDMIHGSVVASKPKTMQEATEMATKVMDKRIRTFADRQTENKRKQNDNQQQQQNKRQNTSRAYTAGTGVKKPYGGSKPLCAKCNYHHDGLCAPKCHKCNRVGHLARDCRSPANTNASNNQRGTETYQHIMRSDISSSLESHRRIEVFDCYLLQNYASSSWCLRELVKILECKEMGWPKHEVQILFYDVKPDVVRKQTESYAEAPNITFQKDQRSTDSWKEALSTAANLSGWDLEDMTNGCFCEDVKEGTKRQGLIQVQLQMIGKVKKIENLKISSVGEGIMVIKKMMSSKPILLVLDDVDDHEQLEALASSPDWFFPGNEDRSLELFRSYAFKEKDSSIEFEEVSQEVVKYVQGHPLALKVLGRFIMKKTVVQCCHSLQMHDMIQSIGRGELFVKIYTARETDLKMLICLKFTIIEWKEGNFYPENIVVIDLSYSIIKQLWTTPKCLRGKFIKQGTVCRLTTTPDFSEITNLEELDLEGCVNLVTVHPSIVMLKRLVVLNMGGCGRAIGSQGCLNVNQLPEAFWSRWWTSIPGFIWNEQHPQRSVSP